ncbi:hypothetical protein CNMCM5623_007379 [Aspergillus felis]|uniref:DUF1754-domain-containing protein n=1 Tax=Aspergillus felis TaxID=1287682 RepID=A0A8H6V4V8_9EURO|nr:hypothetical protein CNMCM5623_007379 [Aspergillus felis]KAF7178888.1 hypothetical protein CNMCM7691_007710 [Aspergillus felis]
MAPGDEYAAGGGGKLKLKGSKVSDGRVEKKKKKSKKSKSDKEGEAGSAPPEARHPDEDRRSEDHQPDPHTPGDADATVGKTEAERKYEEARKKRLLERLKREGVKTHKERVEELNKYLSRLSEHHDILDPVKWGLETFSVIYVRILFSNLGFRFKLLLHGLPQALISQAVELPLAQTPGIAGALCGLSYEGSCLSRLTTAYPRLKAIGELPEIEEFGIDCTTSYVRHQAGRRQQVRAVYSTQNMTVTEERRN